MQSAKLKSPPTHDNSKWTLNDGWTHVLCHWWFIQKSTFAVDIILVSW